MKGSLWESFRDELVATAMVMVVTVSGSFYLAYRLTTEEAKLNPVQPTQSPAHQVVDEMVKVLGQYDAGVTPGVTPTITTLPTIANLTPEAEPTADPLVSEVFYGVGGLYEYDAYRMELNSPRLVFDARNSQNRKLVIDVVLTNKTITEGLQGQLTASIIKDGTIIVPAAALSLSESKIVMPGQSHAYQARLSLIDSTDVKELSYKPSNAPATIHNLIP